MAAGGQKFSTRYTFSMFFSSLILSSHRTRELYELLWELQIDVSIIYSFQYGRQKWLIFFRYFFLFAPQNTCISMPKMKFLALKVTKNALLACNLLLDKNKMIV